MHLLSFREKPWEVLSPLKVARASVSLLNLGTQLILAGGSNQHLNWRELRTYFWNNETLEFKDDLEIDAFPNSYFMEHATSTTIPLDYVREMCQDYL